jgi:ribose-phosphate pyrophosphokinase
MFKITNNRKEELEIKSFLFPGGEVGIKLEPNNYKFFYNGDIEHFNILAKIHNSNDLISLAMIKDSLDRLSIKFNCKNIPVNLIITYLPYARQDRVCVDGEAFSLKVLGNFINSLNFNLVTIFDPHSSVSEAVINNCKVVTQLNIIEKFEAFRSRVLNSNSVFISPDAGANKKTADLAKYFEHKDFIRADKLRNLSTGEIKETIVYADDLTGVDVFVVDDIADGGRTFIELAKVLKSKNANKVILYVTHGIFSKGFDALLKNNIDEIYTTNSFINNFTGYMPVEPELNILDVEKLF